MARLISAALLTALTFAPLAAGAAQPQRETKTGVDTAKFDLIAPLVYEAIAEKKLPGAVVLIGRDDRVLYEKAIGHRALVPAPEPMTQHSTRNCASTSESAR